MPRNLTMPWDVSVPTDRIVPFLTAAEESVSRIAPAAICYAVGHVGDGNIHYSVFPSEDTPEDAISRIYDRIDEIIWTMGGSVVAEHGVGSIFVDRVKARKAMWNTK